MFLSNIIQQFYLIHCLPVIKSIVIFGILAIAIIYLIGAIVEIVRIEKDYDKKLENKTLKYNIKKGFNRLDVILCVICTLIFSCAIFAWQLDVYKDFDKNNVRFYNIETKQKIDTQICDYFPELKMRLSSYYHIETLTPQVCVCQNYDDDLFILEHKKDVYIRMPRFSMKVLELIKCLFLLFLFTGLFYFVMRGVYILFVKIIVWFIQGFTDRE